MESFFSASQEEKELKPKDLFKRLAKAAAKPKDKDWRTKESLRRSSMKRDQIGSTTASIKRHQSSLKKSMLKRGSSQADIRMCLTRCRAVLCWTILTCNAGLTLKNWWLLTPCCQITLLPQGSLLGPLVYLKRRFKSYSCMYYCAGEHTRSSRRR